MFCDLVDSTGIATKLDAEEWRDLVGAYIDAASAAVVEMGGKVAKKLGDGLMALFGYPVAQENDVERAVRAALTIQRSLDELNTESVLFDHIHERRGITPRRNSIERELSSYETIAHDFENLNLQRSNSQFNFLVLVLALWSAFGALATAASLFVALHSDGRELKVRELAVDFSAYFSEQLMDISFWTAFVGLALAASISLIFVMNSFVSTIRRVWRSRMRQKA